MENADHFIKKQKTLTNREILLKADVDDVFYFLQTYARKDKKFNLAFKTHFINTCEITEIGPLLASILNSLVKPKLSAESIISKSQYNLFVQTAKVLHIQMEDKLATDQYIACFEICYAVLDKITYLGNIYFSEKKLETLSSLYHKKISELLQIDIAPELRIRILEYLLTLNDKSYYNYHSEYHIIDILEDANVSDKFFLSKIEQTLVSKFQKGGTEKYITQQIVIAYLRLIHFSAFKVQIQLYELFDLDELQSIYNQLYEKEFYKAILYSILLIPSIGRHEQIFNDILIKTHGKSNDKKALVILLYDAFIKYRDFKYFDNLKNMSSIGQWKKTHKLIKNVLNQSESIHDYAQFLKKEDLFNELADLIKKHSDWELIRDFSYYLFEKNKYKLELIYKQYISKEIKNNRLEDQDKKLLDFYQFIRQNNNEEMLKKIRKHVENFKSNN